MLRVTFLALLAAGSGCGVDGLPDEPPADRVSETSAAVVFGRVPRATGGFPSVVSLVSLEPVDGSVASPGGRTPPVLDQFGTAFHPRVLLAQAGDSILFENGEDVLHNVHVQNAGTGETVFNVGTLPYRSYEHPFPHPGVFEVSCDTHPAMAAFLVVSASPYAAVATPEGTFEIEGVPAGKYRLSVWNVDPDRRLDEEVAIPGSTPRVELSFP